MSAAPSLPPNFDRNESQPPRRPLWQRLLFSIGIGMSVLAILVVIGIEFLLHSTTAHHYILQTAEQKIAQSLGSPVMIGNYELNFHGISPTADLYDVVVPGAEPHPNPPLLRVDHIRVGVHVASLWNRQWDLNEIRIDHPVAYVLTDKHGRTNLPQKKRSSQSSTDMFSLTIRHALLDGGEVFYNNRKSVVEADLHDVHFQSTYTSRPVGYAGAISYDHGHLKIANYNTLDHDFHARFVATPSQFQLTSAVLQSGSSSAVLDAILTDYSQPQLAGDYRIVLHGGQFRTILRNSSVPNGVIHLSGNFHYSSYPNRPMLDELAMKGTLRSKRLEVHTPQFTGPIRDLAGDYVVAGGTLRLNNLRARVLGGLLNGSFVTTDITGAQASKLQANLEHISLAGLKKMLPSTAWKNVDVGGAANASVYASWKKSFTDVRAAVNLDFHSNVAPAEQTSAVMTSAARPVSLSTAGAPAAAASAANPPPNQSASGAQPRPPSSSIPVSGHLGLFYSSRAGQLTVENGLIRTPETTIRIHGSLNSPAGLAVKLSHVDLHQLVTVIAAFTPPAKTPAIPPSLSGVASFYGTVKGTTKSPQIQGVLLLANLQINGSHWQALRANVRLSPSQATISNGFLQSRSGGHATFKLSAGLRQWSFTRTSPFNIAANGMQLGLVNLSKVAGTNVPASGTVSMNLKVHGTREDPAGTARVVLAKAAVSGQPIPSANLNAQSNGTRVQASFSLKLPAGIVFGNGTYDLASENYTARLQANGIRLASLKEIKAKDLPLDGILNVSVIGAGNFHNPQLTAIAEVPTLAIQDQRIRDLALQANIRNHVANVVLNSRVINTSVQGRAQIELTGNYQTVASFNTQSIPLEPLLAAYAPAQAGKITGRTEIHANLRGPLKDRAAIEAHIIVPTLSVSYGNVIHIATPQPIHIDYVNGVLNLQHAWLVGTDTNLQLQGRVPVVNRAAPVALLVQGTVNLKLAELINPDLKSSGQLQFDINSFGNRAMANVQGQVRIIHASLALGTAPAGLQNGNGILTLTGNRLNVTKFEGDVGGGRVTASGGIVYRPAMTFDLAIAARDIRMLYPPGIRTAVGGDLMLTGTPQTAYLRGQVRLLQLSFSPDFDAMSLLTEFSGSAPPPPSRGFTDNLQLDFRILAPHGIDLVSRNLSLQGGLNLNVRGTASDPVMLGRVNLSEGDMILSGNRYVLQGATVDFVNPVRTEPVINALVNTTIDQYSIGMRFEGPVEHLRTNYSSDPALPPADIINLLAFGKTTEQAAANPNPPGSLAAESAIASAVSGQVTNRLQKIVGISRLSVDPTLAGTSGSSQANPGAVITIQQRVTGKIFVTFSTDVTSTQREVIQLQYQVSPRLAVSGTRDQNGGFAFDTRIKKSW